MKYKDKNLIVEADRLFLYDTERPTQALIDIFNPEKNNLPAQGLGIIHRCVAIIHEVSEKISMGILDPSFHSVMPIAIYVRDPKFTDSFYCLSNKLVIKESKLARDLLISVAPKFYNDPQQLVSELFATKEFVYLLFNIKETKSIQTSLDYLSKRRGVIAIHNPNYQDTSQIMKYCLDKNMHMIENIDGSAEIIRI